MSRVMWLLRMSGALMNLGAPASLTVPPPLEAQSSMARWMAAVSRVTPSAFACGVQTRWADAEAASAVARIRADVLSMVVSTQHPTLWLETLWALGGYVEGGFEGHAGAG